MAASKIVSAAMTAVAPDPMNPTLSQRLEAAMVAEIEACLADGVTDPEVIKVRKLKALDLAKARE